MVETNSGRMGQCRCRTAPWAVTHPSNNLLPRPLFGEPDGIYSLPSLLFPCQDSLQYWHCCQRCWVFMMSVSVCLLVPRRIHLGQKCPNMWRSFNFTKIQAAGPRTISCLSFLWVDGKTCSKCVLSLQWREWYCLVFTEQSQELGMLFPHLPSPYV